MGQRWEGTFVRSRLADMITMIERSKGSTEGGDDATAVRMLSYVTRRHEKFVECNRDIYGTIPSSSWYHSALLCWRAELILSSREQRPSIVFRSRWRYSVGRVHRIRTPPPYSVGRVNPDHG